jgi:sugar fermentation stimulation protein A
MTLEAEPVRFPEPLKEGIVVSRPNRFIMMVRTESGEIKCHCPTTGRLGNARITNLPCLYSLAPTAEERATRGTVEAISFDSPGISSKSWIGINQTAVNRYVEFFLRTGQLRRMAFGKVQREVRLGRSRIDFLVGDTFVEVKTPLTTLPSGSAERVAHARFNSFDRLIRHMQELAGTLHEGRRAVIALCYLYDAPPFRPPERDRYNARILREAARAAKRGVERWQVNMGLDRDGVVILRYFRNEGT